MLTLTKAVTVGQFCALKLPQSGSILRAQYHPSDIVRQALEEHMRSRTPSPNCRDLAERIGLIGSAKGLPADLSTNPDHMEGFGRG